MADQRFGTKDVALIVVFTALYALFSFIPLFQLTGLGGRLITATSILAPIIGILVGPAIGGSSTLLGGLIALSFNAGFSLPSLVAGIVAALFGGLLTGGKRSQCALLYSAFLSVFAFYPTIGPAWLFPQMMWYQVFGLVLLVSPLQKVATENFRSGKNINLFFAFLITALSSTLSSQVAGSIVYEAVYWPVLIPSLDIWAFNWQTLTFLYPAERTTIALIAALVGTPLLRVVKSAKLSIHTNKEPD